MNFCGPIRAKRYLLWQSNEIIVLNCRICLEWPCVASPRMVLLFSQQSTCLILKCLFMALYGRLSSFLVVIDPNSLRDQQRFEELLWFIFLIRKGINLFLIVISEENLLWQARYSGNSNLLNRAHNYATPSCDQLERIYSY